MAETETILLSRFADSGDAEAFAEIIRRYAGLVYSAALRVLADMDRASDVAQETFLQLAKDAGTVTGSLPGWLHRVATHKAIDQVRRDTTRRHREAEYMTVRPQETAEWKEISPYVDEGLSLLEPHLRQILISHFLEGRSTREIAKTQGVSQATISRRIESGVELLRAGLRRRGILVAAGTLSLLLGEHAVQAAPPALFTELGKIALISGSLAATTTGVGTALGLNVAATGILTAVKSNVVAVAAVVAIGLGSIIITYQVTRPSKEVSSESADSVMQGPSGAALTVGFDPSGGIALVDELSQRPEPDARIIASVGQGGESAWQIPRNPSVQGLAGPEAAMDPRTYMSLRDDSGSAVVAASPSSTQEGATDQAPPAAAVESAEPLRDSVSEQCTTGESTRTKESPYEMVLRMRREAAGRPHTAAGLDVPAAASIGPVIARAELKLVPPFQDCPATALGFQRQDTTTVKPSGIQETPADAPREPVYFVVHAGDGQIQGITYRSTRPPGEVVLYLDTDGDGLWSDERVYVGRRLWIFSLTATYEFGPVYLKQGDGQPGGNVFYPHCSDGKWLTFYPAFYRDGTVVLDGVSRRITLVDTDFDGRFNEMFEPPARDSRDPNSDVIAIDCGCFSPLPGGGRRSEAVILPLSKIINLDGRFYGIEVTEDGSTVEFRRAEPAFGLLDFGGKDVSVDLWSNSGPQQVSGAGQTWRLPAGRHYARSLDLTEIVGSDRWAFKMTSPGELKDFEIAPGKTTTLKIGPPFQAKGIFRRFAYNPDVQVRVDLEGQAGERYSAVVTKNDQKVPEPSFRILNGVEQVVQSGQLADS